MLSPGCVGSAYTTIQSAVNAAANGDLISVCAGTYPERVTITNKTLTLRSRSGAGVTTIDGMGLGKTISVTGASDVIIDGFTIVGGRNTPGTGANVYCSLSDLTLRDSVLSGGSAYNGGGLGASDCTGLVENNTFENNTVTWKGGGAYIKGDALAFQGNTLRTNEAVNKGGGLYVDGDSEVRGNTFETNHAEYGGAAMVTWGYGTIAENTVVFNTSSDDGAGLYIDHGDPIVEDNLFEDNNTDGEGGGMRVKLGSPTIRNNTFNRNHADYRGGAMKVSHDDVTMTGNTYTDNTAWVTAGGVLMYESASLVTNETYIHNVADHGGGMAIINGWADITLEDVTFEGNEADEGGHLYIDLPWQSTNLRRVSFLGGTADDGGAVWAVDTDIRFENVLFDGNEASDSGGALYLDLVTGEVLNSVVIGNDAPEGSGATVLDSPNVDVINTVFRQNTSGAAFEVAAGAVPDVTYCDFNGNTSNFSGMGNVVGSNGNIGALPSFVSEANGNFALRTTSALVNTGDPAISDTNGTRSDIGLFGGPEAF